MARLEERLMEATHRSILIQDRLSEVPTNASIPELCGQRYQVRNEIEQLEKDIQPDVAESPSCSCEFDQDLPPHRCHMTTLRFLFLLVIQDPHIDDATAIPKLRSGYSRDSRGLTMPPLHKRSSKRAKFRLDNDPTGRSETWMTLNEELIDTVRVGGPWRAKRRPRLRRLAEIYGVYTRSYWCRSRGATC
jgi:hypothetical protein